MDALSSKKIAEAKQHLADAEKSLKTSLFKRKPDYDAAASYYEQAGSCYKVAKDYNQAIQCFTKSAEYFTQLDSSYNAAKQYEQIGLLANENKNYAIVGDSFMKASELMLNSGTRDSAQNLLEKGANMLKLTAPESALKLLRRAIQIADSEDKRHDLVSYYESAASLAIRMNDLKAAIEFFTESLDVLDRVGSPEQITKSILSVILIHLSRDDWVMAMDYWQNAKKRYNANNNRIDELLEAYDEKDDEKFRELVKKYLPHTVDNEVLKMANAILKSEDWLKSVSGQSKPAAQNIYAPPLPPVVTPSVYEPATTANQSEPVNNIPNLETDNQIEDRVVDVNDIEAKTENKEDEEEDELDLL